MPLGYTEIFHLKWVVSKAILSTPCVQLYPAILNYIIFRVLQTSILYVSNDGGSEMIPFSLTKRMINISDRIINYFISVSSMSYLHMFILHCWIRQMFWHFMNSHRLSNYLFIIFVTNCFTCCTGNIAVSLLNYKIN